MLAAQPRCHDNGCASVESRVPVPHEQHRCSVLRCSLNRLPRRRTIGFRTLFHNPTFTCPCPPCKKILEIILDDFRERMQIRVHMKRMSLIEIRKRIESLKDDKSFVVCGEQQRKLVLQGAGWLGIGVETKARLNQPDEFIVRLRN